MKKIILILIISLSFASITKADTIFYPNFVERTGRSQFVTGDPDFATLRASPVGNSAQIQPLNQSANQEYCIGSATGGTCLAALGNIYRWNLRFDPLAISSGTLNVASASIRIEYGMDNFRAATSSVSLYKFFPNLVNATSLADYYEFNYGAAVSLTENIILNNVSGTMDFPLSATGLNYLNISTSSFEVAPMFLTDRLQQNPNDQGNGWGEGFKFGTSTLVLASGFYSTSSVGVSMLYPINNTSTRDFNNWVIYGTNITTSTNGQFGVEYGTQSGSYSFQDSINIIDGITFNSYPPFATSSAKTMIINKSRTLYNQASSTIYARPYFFDSNLFRFGYGSEIKFLISSTSTIPTDATSTLASPFLEDTDFFIVPPLSTIDCSNSGQWTDTYLGIPFFASSTGDRALCEVRKLIYGLFNIPINMLNENKQRIRNLVGYFYNIFPLNIYISINDTINNAQATSTDAKTEIKFVDYSSTPVALQNLNFLVLGSSTIGWFKDSTGVDIRDIMDKIAYVFTAFIMLIFVRKAVKSFHQPDIQ